jgi:hypothetical protein
MPAVDFPLWIILEGVRQGPDGTQGAQLWHSSLIVKRLSPTQFMTASGKIYGVEGSIDADGMRDSTWSDDLIAAFQHGFPSDWLDRLDPFLQIGIIFL